MSFCFYNCLYIINVIRKIDCRYDRGKSLQLSLDGRSFHATDVARAAVRDCLTNKAPFPWDRRK